jgi:hypothetical protein
MNGYRIVERIDGGGREYPIVEAIVEGDWFPPVQAFHYQPDHQWLLIVDPKVVAAAGLDLPIPAAAKLNDLQHAREWVELIAALYVKAAAA